jgi:hypothetical protein
MSRREFIIRKITVNGKSISRVLVDDHVRKHKDITDDLILDLVKQLDGTDSLPDDVKGEFQYYVNLFESEGKQYRIVWLLEKGKLYIGVVTVYRDSRRKK